jgi:protocatechuate 3,4-dioxygenase beta subunit
VDLDGNNKIEQFEIDHAKAKGALKVEVLATPAVDAAPADKNQDLWFGNFLLGTINGFKYEDIDGSGTFDAVKDKPLENVKFDLKDSTGKVVQTKTSGPDGKFQFAGLVAGTYTVSESTATDTNNDKIADNLQDMVLDPTVETVTIKSGETINIKRPFANFVLGSIHGVKFEDLNGDGDWDKGTDGKSEPRLPGVKFDLYKFIKETTKQPSSLGGPVTTYFWEDVGNATTDVHGEFWFTGLQAGKYEVRERAGQPFMQTTKQPTAPPDGKFNPATSTTLFVIESRREFVWELDTTLKDEKGNVIGGPAVGSVQQGQLKDSTYGAFNRPIDGMGGPVDGFIDQGEKDFAYNKAALKIQILADPTNPNPAPADQAQDLWFGNVRAGLINGFKYEDRDQNGSFDPAIDVPMKNVTMLLNGKDANGKEVSLSTKTAADGSFAFGGLLPSNADGYIIKESAATDTNSDGTPDSPLQELILDTTEAKVVLQSGQTVNLDKNLFGNFILGSIHGFKFHDKDADGVRDAGEEPLKDVVFNLFKFQKTETTLLASNVTKNVFHWTPAGTAKTDVHGEFWFTGLEAGKYQVVENKGSMLPTTGQATKSPVPVDNTKNEKGEVVGDKDFLDPEDFQGLDPAKAVSLFTIRSREEYVWEFNASKKPRDLDGNGVIDANEQQMAYNKSVLKTEILAAPVAPATLFDSGGFEAPAYTTTAFGSGMLEGQPIGAPIVWQRTVNAGPSSANVQNTVFAPGGGTQAVRMNRAAGATDRWGIKFTNAPLTNTVTITWSMRVEGPAGNPATQFGPFFGVEAYDDTSGFIGLIGSLGVDATTGDVLFQEANTGFFAETGATAAFGTWNNFEIRMNFTTKQYSVFFNGAFLRTEGFVDQSNKPGGINRITDATLTGLTAAANSDALTGTAYFDNFLAKDVGAAAAPSLWFGNAFAGTINGFKYEDVNNDGKFDDKVDKPGGTWHPGQNKQGAVFDLKDANGKVVASTTSDPMTGKFSFTNVLPGTYTVVESDKTDTNKDGTPDNKQDMVLDTRVANVTLASVPGGQTKDAGQFRNFVLGSIHGVKFQDFNGNGEWDKSGNNAESPWAGIKFDLFKLVSKQTITVASNKVVNVYNWQDFGDATTDIHGEFWFTGLDPGFYYTVRERENQNYEQTTSQPTKSPVPIDANKDGDFLDAGDFAGLDPNAVNSQAMFILSRYEFEWQVGAHSRLRDLNNDGIIDASEKTMAINKSVLKLPQIADGGENSNDIDLIFGNMFITGSIHGFKFEDIDGDGVWDQSNPKGIGAEPGLGGIFIELRDSKGDVATLANGKLARTRTAGGNDPNTQKVEKKGEFWFTGVLPGTYTLHEILSKSDSNGDTIPDDKQGLVNSTPISTGPITIGPREEWVYTPGAAGLTPLQISKGIHEVFDDGTNKNNVNEKLIFGNYVTGSIHGFKFLDLNADGQYDPSAMGKERPFEWGVFELLDMSGKSLGIQFTNDDGEFWFTDLRPGKYTVRERADLIDRNDLNGDGLPDIVDKDGDGYPESMGNGIPDTKEGLMLSTPADVTVQIWSREELVWQAGAAMLGGTSTVFVEPDDFSHLTDISNKYENVVLSEAISGTPIYSVNPDGFDATTGSRVFGWDLDFHIFVEETFGFSGQQGIFQAQFAVPVTSVSIDVIANDGNDRGVLIAYDENGVFLGSVTTSLLNDVDVNPNNDWQTLTITAPAGKKIGFIQAGGDGLSASDVGLDNLQYVVDPLKEEKLVGTQLMWGDFYAGAIHGVKVQQGSGLPAPNIPIKLIGQSGQTVATTTTNAAGEFWFLDVVPGFYTIAENPTPSVIVMAMPIPVIVGHAQVVAAPGATTMPYPGLQTVTTNSSLRLENLIEGSVHGIVCNQANQPLAGITVTLNGPENAQTVTNAQGQFHFRNLTPGAYAVNVNGNVRVVIVGSGEEEAAMAGLSAPLNPGQFETVNPELKIVLNQPNVDTTGPRVIGVKASSTQWTEAFLDEIDPGVGNGEGFPIPGGGDQLLTLPWININSIIFKFSENVVINAADVSLHGVSVANYGGTFSYDPVSFTGELLLPNAINADKLVLHINDTVKDAAGNALDGEWTNGVSNYPSGNNTAGADFNFRFNVLPGDANRNGTNTGTTDGVLGTDVIKVRNAQFLTTADSKYSVFDDVNGSGNVSGVDVVAVRNRQFTGLPAGNPVAPAGSGASLDEDDVDSVFGDGAAVFGKAAVAGDAGDDSLLLALASSSSSSADSAFASAEDGDSGEAEAVGSIDDLFAALGS